MVPHTHAIDGEAIPAPRWVLSSSAAITISETS